MPEKYHNHGLHISGSNLYGPVAQGDHASATQYGSGASGGGEALPTMLQELRQLIATHAASIDNPGNAGRDLDEIEAEIARDEPDRERLVDTLARLARRVATVTTVATAVTRVGELIHRMFT
jgi:hypothetical protein